MIVYALWKFFPVLQVRQPVFYGGVRCGRLGWETEGESERERKSEHAHYCKKKTRHWVRVITVDVLVNDERRWEEREDNRGGGGNTFSQVNGC